jgi:poly(3-hydroxyalkanoate) synthetase
MKAIVKNITNGTQIEDADHRDTFRMEYLIGKEVLVEPKKDCKDWFMGDEPKSDEMWNWHRSWLEFVNDPEDLHSKFDYE